MLALAVVLVRVPAVVLVRVLAVVPGLAVERALAVVRARSVRHRASRTLSVTRAVLLTARSPLPSVPGGGFPDPAGALWCLPRARMHPVSLPTNAPERRPRWSRVSDWADEPSAWRNWVHSCTEIEGTRRQAPLAGIEFGPGWGLIGAARSQDFTIADPQCRAAPSAGGLGRLRNRWTPVPRGPWAPVPPSPMGPVWVWVVHIGYGTMRSGQAHCVRVIDISHAQRQQPAPERSNPCQNAVTGTRSRANAHPRGHRASPGCTAADSRTHTSSLWGRLWCQRAVGSDPEYGRDRASVGVEPTRRRRARLCVGARRPHPPREAASHRGQTPGLPARSPFELRRASGTGSAAPR